MAVTVDTEGRVPKAAAKSTVIFLYVLALVSVSLRTFIRYHHRKLQWLDDGCAFLAALLMTICLALFFAMVDDLYIVEMFIYDTLDAAPYLLDAVPIAMRIQVYTLVYNILCITGIFAIKFSFLFFFYNLLSHIRGLLIYWRCVVAFTAFGWAFSTGFSTFGCPYTDERALQCAQGPTLWKAVHASVVLIVFDVLTDCLVISIPVIILKRTKIALKKKIWLAGTLCLSIVMIVVAILQAATLTWRGVDAIDVVWEIYFQFVELTLAVMVVSIVAFRAFFVQNDSRSRSSPRSPGYWTSQEKHRKKFQKVWTSSSNASSGWRYTDRSREMPPVPPPSKNLPMRLPVVNIQTASDTTNSAHRTIHAEDHFHSDAWQRNDMQARVEPSLTTLHADTRAEYHRIQRAIGSQRQGQHDAVHDRLNNQGSLSSPGFPASGTQGPDRSSLVPPSSQGITPVSTSRSNTPPNYDIFPPSPVSPTMSRRSHIPVSPPMVMTSLQSTASMRTQRNDAPRHEALRSAEISDQQQQPSHIPSPAPVAVPPRETEALQPARRLTHIAAMQRSTGNKRVSQRQSTHGAVELPADERPLPATPDPHARRSRRSKAPTEQRESGLKRAISNSLALAWDLKAQRGENK